MLFNDTVDSLNLPPLSDVPFSLIVRKDVVNAAVVAFLPPEELMVLLDYVVSLSLRQRMKPPLLPHGNFLTQSMHKGP